MRSPASSLIILFLLPNQTDCAALWRDFNLKVYSLISLAETYATDCWTLPDLRRNAETRTSYFGKCSHTFPRIVFIIVSCSPVVSSRSAVSVIGGIIPSCVSVSFSSHPTLDMPVFSRSISSLTPGIALPRSTRKIISYSVFVCKFGRS